MRRSDVEALLLELTAGEADPAFRRRVVWTVSRLDLADGMRVLEVGAGVAPVVLLAARIAGIAPLAVELDLGRAIDARRHDYRGAAVVADAGALPLRGGTVDRVIAAEVLEHLADDRSVLAELRRVVRERGRLCVTVPSADYPTSWDPLARLMERVGARPPRRGWYVGIWHGHRRLYQREELLGVCRTAGWEVLEVIGLVKGGLPFAHFLLYGIGKRLLDAGLVRGRAAAAVGRGEGSASPAPRWHPVGLAVRLMRWFEARAERRRSGRSVHLAVLLERGPESARQGVAAGGSSGTGGPASAPSRR